MSPETGSAPPGVPAGPGRLLMIEQGGRGGEADYAAELTRALADEGWLVDLATADDHRYRPASGVTVHRVFHYTRGDTTLGRAVRRAGLGPVANGVRFLAAVPRLVCLARGADLVHTHGWEFAPLGLIAVACLRLGGTKVVQTPHNTFDRGRSYDGARRALARVTSNTIVHSQADLTRLGRGRDGRVVVIPHGEYGALARSGGDPDRQASRAALGIPGASPVTLFFGYLRRDKGLDDLLAALGKVAELRLIIAGKDAGGLAQVRNRIEDPDLARRVILREGFLEMSEAATFFAAADTVVLPYEIASQSGVLLLAYGFRRPVIVYPVGGLTEAVIDGETGWICASPGVGALTDALAASVAAGWPECQRRGEAGARFAEERFGWPGIARRTSEVYHGVLGDR